MPPIRAETCSYLGETDSQHERKGRETSSQTLTWRHNKPLNRSFWGPFPTTIFWGRKAILTAKGGIRSGVVTTAG